MLLDYKFKRYYIKAHFKEIKKSMTNNNDFYRDITNSEMKIYKKLKIRYPNIDDKNLKEIIHFSITSWSDEEIESAKNLNFCNNCGYCCKTRKIVLEPEEISKYLNENPEMMNNIEPSGNKYKFKQDNPCKYYKKDGKCNISKLKPKSCRIYPFSDAGMHINPQCNNAMEIIINKTVQIVEECLKLAEDN